MIFFTSEMISKKRPSEIDPLMNSGPQNPDSLVYFEATSP